MWWISNAYAHGGEVPQGFFEVKWAWDPTLLFFATLAILYARGLRAYAGRAPVERWQVGLFYLGIAILVAACLPPIDPVSDQLFSMHMVQHLLITAIGVPLITFGAPFLVAMRGIPPVVRRR